MSHLRHLNPAGQPPPVGQYTNVAISSPTSPLVHVAGQLPVDEDGTVLAEDDFDRQASLVFERLAAVLEGAGSSLRAVTFLRGYMVRHEDFPRFREARRRAFESAQVVEPPPATTIVVAGLYGGALIELDAVAVLAP